MKWSDPLATADPRATRFSRWLSGILFASALAAVLTLLISDGLHFLAPTAIHRCAGALAFMLIGASYVVLQIGLQRSSTEKLKAVLLGIAFLFWGGGQFLPPGLFATALDTSVVVIFVVDLGLIIIEHLKRNPYE